MLELHGHRVYDLRVWCKTTAPAKWENIQFKKILNEEGSEILPILEEHEKRAIVEALNGRGKEQR